jgi:hypothetical protein
MQQVMCAGLSKDDAMTQYIQCVIYRNWRGVVNLIASFIHHEVECLVTI